MSVISVKRFFGKFHMLDVCRQYVVCAGCMQYLHHFNYYSTFIKFSVNLNLRVARLPTPDKGRTQMKYPFVHIPGVVHHLPRTAQLRECIERGKCLH